MMEDCRSEPDCKKGDSSEARTKPFPAMLNTRLSKVEFPHFWGEDIDGWVFKCNSLFEMEDTPSNKKIAIATIHLEGSALHWHKRFM